MAFSSLQLNRSFLEFNRSQILDPSLRTGPSHQDLFQLVHEARDGSASASLELADTLDWTLREETFEAFQKIHGPLPIRYRDWFYSKLVQFLEALVYEGLSTSGLAPDGTNAEPETDQPWNEGFVVLGSVGPPVEDSEVEQAFEPSDSSVGTWLPLIKSVSASQERLRALQRIVAQRHSIRPVKGSEAPSEPKTAASAKKWEWAKNAERDRIIRNLLARGESRLRVCEALDEHTINPLPIMKRYGALSWVAAWKDPELHPHLQQLLSKRRPVPKPVKS